MEPEPESITANATKNQIKPTVNPMKVKAAEIIKQKAREGYIKDVIQRIESQLEPGDGIEEFLNAMETAEYVISAISYEPMHRDSFYPYMRENHPEIMDLESFKFYNEHLQLSSLDYFKTCGSCTECGYLFLSMGVISWERINGHYKKEHPAQCDKQSSLKIRSFDIIKALKGKKRGRGRPPAITLTPPAGAIHVGDEIYMVRTGTGPAGQPSYTLMNMAATKSDAPKSNKKLDDFGGGLFESQAKKRKANDEETSNLDYFSTSSGPRTSTRLKRKSYKAEHAHFLDELDDEEWIPETEEQAMVVRQQPALELATLRDSKVNIDQADESNDVLDLHDPSSQEKMFVLNGEMNKSYVKDLVYFFNLYLGYDICKKVLRSIEDGKVVPVKGVYKTRDVLVRRSPVPVRDENGIFNNQHYCVKMKVQDLEPILEQELGLILCKQTLVAQQYSFVNNVRCTEKVSVYQFETEPELSLAAKTYTFTSTGDPHDLVNITVINKNFPDEEGYTDVPGLHPTKNEGTMAREVNTISKALSSISCRDTKPRFDERGLVMSQKYCCNKTLTEVMTDWWQGFIEMTQLKELVMSSEKLKLKRKIPINGTEAMPEKKLFKANLGSGHASSQSLEVDFTYFNTSEGSLNLTFICIQWIKKGVKVESDHIDLPSMVDFDSLTVYRRRSTKESSNTHKSYYKSSEISFLDSVKILVNRNCVPRNQAIFTLQNKGRMVAELRSYLGMFHPSRTKPAELYIGGYKYTGKGSAYRRSFEQFQFDLVVMVTHYKFDKSYTDSSCPEDMPQSFSQAEISWANKPVKGIGSSQINSRMVDDSTIPFYPKPASIRRNYRYKCDPEMFALNQKIGTRAITNRLKILNRNKSSATRPGMQTINNLYNRKPKDGTTDETTSAVQGISEDGGNGGGKRRKRARRGLDDDDEEAELKCFKDQLVSFDSLVRFPKSITYNKKLENGMVMVKNNKRLLYALIGSTTEVNTGWSPLHLEVETYEPSLTNAHMVLTCFSVPNIVHRQRKTPKVCLGPICLSASKSEEDATILGEHLRYNNENVTRISSMAAMNDELYHSLRNGMKSFNSVFLYDESNVLNSATNRAKCQKHTLKLSEVALSHEIGAITVSWEVYMDKIIGLKQESDMVDLLLALEDGEEYMLIDDEGKRLFQLTELEKSQLDEDELRYHEIEFFEWLGTGKYPDMPWKDYVMQKVSFNPTTPNQVFHSKAVNENDFEAWNSDQSYDNQFFGNIILQKGTLPKQQYNKVGKKKRMAATTAAMAAGTAMHHTVVAASTAAGGIPSTAAKLIPVRSAIPVTAAAAVQVTAEEGEVATAAAEGSAVYSQTYTTTIEESPAVFTAFDRVVVDGTFML